MEISSTAVTVITPRVKRLVRASASIAGGSDGGGATTASGVPIRNRSGATVSPTLLIPQHLRWLDPRHLPGRDDAGQQRQPDRQHQGVAEDPRLDGHGEFADEVVGSIAEGAEGHGAGRGLGDLA